MLLSTDALASHRQAAAAGAFEQLEATVRRLEHAVHALGRAAADPGTIPVAALQALRDQALEEHLLALTLLQSTNEQAAFHARAQAATGSYDRHGAGAAPRRIATFDGSA